MSFEDWKEVELEEVIEFNPKESLKKGTIAKKVSMTDLEPFIRKIQGFTIEKVGGGSRFRNGDTLLARITPCLENGKTAYVDILDTNEVAFGSTEFIVMRAKPNITDNKFVYYLATSPFFREIAIKSMTGTSGRQRAQVSVLEKTTMKIPSLNEQKKIAETFSSLDEKIELNNQINKNLEEMAQAIFKSWFVDFEPFQDGEFAESELGLIPKGWSINTIQELSKEDGIICGKTPSTKIKENYGDYMPFITIPDMHGKVFVSRTERMLSKKGVESQPKKTLPPNSINVSCIATPGLVTITSEPSQTNQQINSVICKDNISYLFMYLSLSNLSDHIRNLGSGGSTTLNLNKTEFSKIKLIVPDQQVMDNFHSLVEPIFNSILKNQKEIELLQDLRDTLLPKLMSGEIRVPLENEGRQQDEQLQRV
jgi:type I restriction enzyme, S subunit